MLADGLAIALAAACLLAAVAGQGGRFSARLDVLNHFAPLWLAGASLAALYGLTLGAASVRPALVGLGVAGMLGAAVLIAPEFLRPIRPPAPAAASRQIKLIQFNVWDRNANIEATADWIAAEKPDIVLMQEVHAPIRVAMTRRGFHYTRGLAHAAIFSRLAPAAAPFKVPPQDWKRLPDFARATFAGPDGPFSVIAVHLVWPTHPAQGRNMAVLEEFLDLYPHDRLIVAGDFNLTPWSFALQRFDRRVGLERRDRALFSWPARLSPTGSILPPAPLLPIDHLYAGRAWRTISLTRGPRLGSDHYPLVARLALTE